MNGALRSFCEEQSNSVIDEDDENFIEEVETMIDAVITSLRFMMKSFDILTRYNEFVEVVGQ